MQNWIFDQNCEFFKIERPKSWEKTGLESWIKNYRGTKFAKL